MWRIPWTEIASNEEVLRTIKTSRKLFMTFRKDNRKFSDTLEKEGLENSTFITHTEGKRNLGKHLMTYLTSVIEWRAKVEW